MIVLTVTGLKKSFGIEKVLEDINLSLSAGERMGLVGVNGSGKTTLLRILSGHLSSDEGNIAIQKGMVIGYLEQSYEAKPGNTVFDELMDIFNPLIRVEQRLREIEQEMAEADEQTLMKLGHEYSKLHDRFEEEDGYAIRSRVTGVLQGLGFTKKQQEQQANLLSGGELTRLTLGRLLLQKPDLLLLDEPTNHLDLQALQWLEDYLIAYPGAVLVVSHDRYFLDRVCTSMTEILFGASEQYKGNYTRYMSQREERFYSRTRAYEQQQKEIDRQKVIIARYRSFNREKSIRAAESREKALDRIELLDKPEEEKQVHFRFESGLRIGDEALKIEKLSKSFGERLLFEDVNLLVRSGERVALIGANGVGKSTLLEILVGHVQPDEGSYRFGANADIGYYEQKQQSLHPDKTVLREVWDDFARLQQHEVRGALGLFLFSGDDVFKPISALSGGEKARVALTKLMLKHKNFLILDEPTNYLDSDSREVLEQALLGYEGTIMAVSHDRYFINSFATKMLVLMDDGILSYDGNYDDYLASLERQNNSLSAMEEGQTKTELVKIRRRLRQDQEEADELSRCVSDAEHAISIAEDELKKLEYSQANPSIYSDPTKAQLVAQDIKELKIKIEKLFLEWEAAELAVTAYEDGV
ncbi:MAG: ABC-F family ATP-binding cassette domain-containing protein [Clostridiales bacterium]|nr:ABC-F family ATP-binding cassette domain-containing protein [Clostridiales bacterium]